MPTVQGIPFDRTETVSNPPTDFTRVLEQNERDGSLLKIPGGTYTIGRTHNVGVNTLGVVCEEGATINVEGGFDQWGITFGNQNFLAQGLYFNHGSGGQNGTGILGRPSGKASLRDIRMLGRADAADPVNSVNALPSRGNAEVHIERMIDFSRGTGYHSTRSGDGNGRIAVWAGGGDFQGTLRVTNSKLVDLGNNAIYASNAGGPNTRLIAEGNIIKHSYGGGFRGGGNGSVCRGNYFEIDMDKSKRNPLGGQSCVRLEFKGNQQTGDTLVEDNHFRLLSTAPGGGATAIRCQHSSTNVTCRRNYVYTELDNDDVVSVNGEGDYKTIFEPIGGRGEWGDMVFEDLHITGPGSGGVYVGQGRDGITFRNCTIPKWIFANGINKGDINLQNVQQSGGPAPKTEPQLAPLGELGLGLETQPQQSGLGDLALILAAGYYMKNREN